MMDSVQLIDVLGQRFDDWQAYVEGLGTSEQMDVSDALARLATRAARLSAYISRRTSGGRHADAVKQQNRAARGVRRALGYTYADDPITF